jgi:hypothetical protein
MGFFRFRRRIKIAPGVYWNIGKKGSALSFGGRGLTHTIGPKGSRTTIGIPGTGVSYTHVQPRSTPITPATASPPNPPLAQPPYKTITSRVFYIFGAILLVIWLLSKVFEQSAPTSVLPSSSSNSASPADDKARIQEWVDRAAKRGEEWGNQSLHGTSSANPQHSPITVRRAVPVEPTAPPAESPPATASVYGAAPLESPAATRPVTGQSTYRVVKVAKRDFLYLRAGPSSGSPVIARIPPETRGIALGPNRAANGSTIWQEVSVEGHTGWVNEIYLEAENPTR